MANVMPEIKSDSKQNIIAICGIKNSGKTTLIRKIINLLCKKGYKVATIKHDGHEFTSDVPGTDSFFHQEAGAYGTAVFSKSQFMVTKRIPDITEKELTGFFPEADIILLEGFKNSSYPKIEVIRGENGNPPASNPEGRFLIVTDKAELAGAWDYAGPDEIDVIVDKLLQVLEKSN